MSFYLSKKFGKQSRHRVRSSVRPFHTTMRLRVLRRTIAPPSLISVYSVPNGGIRECSKLYVTLLWYKEPLSLDLTVTQVKSIIVFGPKLRKHVSEQTQFVLSQLREYLTLEKLFLWSVKQPCLLAVFHKQTFKAFVFTFLVLRKNVALLTYVTVVIIFYVGTYTICWGRWFY